MTRRHLGDRIHELVDGRLSRVESIAAMAHLDECDTCSAEHRMVTAEREALQTSGTGIDMSFTEHLLDRKRIAEIAKAEPRRHQKAAQGAGVNVARVSIGAGAFAAAALVGLYALGAPEQARLSFHESASTATETVDYMSAQTLRSGELVESWIHPDWESSGLVPIDGTVIRTQDGDLMFVAQILKDLEPVLVFEQRGTLPEGMAEAYETVAEDEREAYLVDFEPTQIVFESGDAVVALACECAVEILEEVAAAFPLNDDPGVLERIGDGIAELADAITGD